MNNFTDAQKALSLAEESHGSAMHENSRYMESLSAKTNNLKAQFQELVLGDGGLSSFLKILTDTGTEILKFANSDVGQLIIKATLLTTSLALLNKGFILLSNSYVSNLIGVTALTIAQEGLSAGIGVLSTELAGLTAIFTSSPFGQVALVVGGVILIQKAIDALTVSFEEQTEKLENANKEYIDSSKEVENISQKLEEVNTKIEEINSQDGITVAKQEELDNLNAEKQELEYILAIEQERARLAQEEAEREAQKTLDKTFSDKDAFGSTSGITGTETSGTGTITEAVGNLNTKLGSLNDRILETKGRMAELSEQQKQDTEEFEGLEYLLGNLEQQYGDLSSKQLDYVDVLKTTTKNLDKDSDEYKLIIGLLEDYSDVTGEHVSILDEDNETIEDNKNKIEDLSDSLGTLSSKSLKEANEATQDQQDMLKELASNIDAITQAYEVALFALDEYNNKGFLSVDTYKQLISIAPQYLATLIDENGQFYANADGVTALYQAQVYEMGVTAARAQVDLANKLVKEGESYAELGNQAINASGGIWEMVKAQIAQSVLDKPEELQALQNRINAIDQLTQSTIKNAKITTSSIKPNLQSTNTHKKNTDARKKNADAIKAQTNALKEQKKALEEEAKALEEQIDNYEIVIDYVKDLLKEEQDAIEEQKEKELEAIEDKIDALEKEQDAFNENIESQIDALEKQKDKQEDYWDSQIDSIKKANKELEDNIRLQQLQEALARAKTKKVKVLKGGKFVYAQDDEAISKAEQELADYENQLAVEKQIAELEKLKEESLKSLDNQIEELKNHQKEVNKTYDQELKDLQTHYNNVEAEYNTRISQYDSYMKQFEEMLEANAKTHAKTLYKELLGEQNNWKDRLKALSTFVTQYDNKKKELDGIKNQINAITSQIGNLESKAKSLQNRVGSISNSVGAQLSQINAMANQAESAYNKVNANYNAIKRTQFRAWLDFGVGKAYLPGWHNSYEGANEALKAYFRENPKAITSRTSSGVDKLNKWAIGSYSIPEDQIALIADPLNPSNREITVGAKLNQGDGVIGNLKKGTGVIPHNLTESLVRLAQFGNNDFDRVVNNNNDSSNIINIENINLPQVKNGEDFVEYLKNNFTNNAIQYESIRR